MQISTKYCYETTPVADKKAMVVGEKYRFTVLTSRLIRIEYSESGYFEDRATQTVINRKFAPVDFKVEKDDKFIKIITDDICLTYLYENPFSESSLHVNYIGKNSSVLAGKSCSSWHFGDVNSKKIPGTVRTLDGVNGECELGESIMSLGSVNVLDDSKSLILTDYGWVESPKEERIDQYLFCYGIVPDDKGWYFDADYDFLGCLKAYYHLTGKQPLIPRYLLGNWWSRFHPYSQEEYTELVKRFKKEDVPFSVAVIDMDWHNVDIDSKYGTGWTGYSWNKELFPDHKAFLEFLHREGYEPTLNLHPQEGIAAHEDRYAEMAEAMGVDPKTEETIQFDISNPIFLENYFSKLHHPMEDEGVSFWWMDWQQGNTSFVPGLDPLWMLNHYHYIDNKRNGKRPVIFSRYAGPGSHRYPVGFSGDTVMSWESLDFQPYFTASASNIGYGWWSHDIGGHMAGIYDDERTARWVQFGVFSPINRLHSAASIFLGKEPWKYGRDAECSMRKFLKLRHEMIPYLYSMNYRSHFYDEPLVQPLYYKYREGRLQEYRNEFLFGTEMIVSPITKPHDEVTMRGSSTVYLPDGIWYDFFTNTKYSGDTSFKAYRNLDNMPVFVKAGGIIPLAKLSHVNDVENPSNLRIKVYAGASGEFELYEDDGVTEAYKDGAYAITKISYQDGRNPSVSVSKACGDLSVVPERRNFSIELIGITECNDISVLSDGEEINATYRWEDNVLYVDAINITDLTVKINDDVEIAGNDIVSELIQLISQAKIENNTKNAVYAFLSDEKISTERKLKKIISYDLANEIKEALAEIISAYLK